MNMAEIALVVVNVVIGIIAFLGGIVLNGALKNIEALRSAELGQVEKNGRFAMRDEVKEDISSVRSETRNALTDIANAQRDGFNKVFDRLDEIRRELSNKADRP